MGYTIKNGEDLEKAFDAVDGRVDEVKSAMKSFDDRLETAGGSLAETMAIVRDVQKQVTDGFARKLPAGAPLGLLDAFVGKTLTWDAIHKHPTAIRTKNGSRVQFEAADPSDLIGRFQDAADQLYILAGAMKMIDGSGRIDTNAVRSLKFYREEYAPLREKLVEAIGKDAFSHTAGSGGISGGTEWDPYEFSNRLIEKARLPLKVVALIPTFNLPRSPFLFPTQLADLAAYYVTEVTTAPPILGTTSGYIADGKGSTTVSGSVTFTGKKLATMAFATKDMEEDSIVPIMSYLEGAVVQAVSNGLENAVLNGDTASTHMDNDVTSATDVRKIWNGLRDYAVNVASSGLQDASGAYINSDANWRDHVRSARKLMADPFKGDASKLAMVVSGNTAIDIGSCEAWRTLYAFGGGATNANGDSTGYRPDGLGSFIVSEFQRGTVSSTGVNTSGGPNTYTTVLQFAPQAWMLGVQRGLRIEVLRERFAEYDQDAVKITWRGDLVAMLPGNHTVATIGVPAS